MAMRHKRTKPALVARLLAMALYFGASGAAAAQTVLSPLPADPATIRLQERVEQVEQQLREATGEIERMRFDLAKVQQDLVRVNKALDDVLVGQGALPAGGAVSPQSGAAPLPSAASAPAGSSRPVSADAEAAYKGTQALLLSGDYPAAETALRAFIKDYPKASQLAEARYWLGQTLLAQGFNSEAAKQFLDVVKLHGTSPRAPDAFARLGLALRGMGNLREACQAFKDLPQRFPAASQSIKELAAREAKSGACPA